MSEWELIDWAERSSLPELLGVRITKTIHMLDRLRLGRGKDGELEKPLVILSISSAAIHGCNSTGATTSSDCDGLASGMAGGWSSCRNSK